MDPIPALAILSLGAFLTALVTALFYVFTVRPRLLEPVPLATLGLLDEPLREELSEQRATVERLNAALTLHADRLTQAVETAGQGSSDGALADLPNMLSAQSEAVATLTRLLNEHTGRFSRLDDQLAQQDVRLQRLEMRLSVNNVEEAEISIREQVQKLVTIGGRLDEWAATRGRQDRLLAEHAQTLAELDRELAAQAQVVQKLDSRVTEHTTMLLTAASERRDQGNLLQRIVNQVSQLVSMVGQLGVTPLQAGQDRLTDIKGIGPVYAGKLYEAGIQTYTQLATMTPQRIYELIDEPKWRLRSIDAQQWIDQARELSAQRTRNEDKA